ncbi:tetratricopeptide repeat protein [Candidatus Neomarinimicrobiota bacterium]
MKRVNIRFKASLLSSCLLAALIIVPLSGSSPRGVEQAARAQKDSTARKPRPKPSARPASSTRRRRPQKAAPQQRPRRPARRPKPRPAQVVSAASLDSITKDIHSLNQRLVDLHNQSVRRFAELNEADGRPANRRYRFAGDEGRINYLTRLQGSDLNSVEVLTELAELERRNHRYERSETYLHKGLAVDPLNQELQYSLGQVYLRLGRTTSAWSTFQEIIYQNPEHIDAHLAQGRIREIEGDYEGALSLYAAAEGEFGPQPMIYFARARNLIETGAARAAIEIADEGLGRYPDEGDLYYVRGRAYARIGMLDEARTDYYDAISLGNSRSEVYLELGDASMQAANYVTAIRAYTIYLDTEPGDGEVALALGRAYLLDLRFKAAIEELQRQTTLYDNKNEVSVWLPQAYYLYSLELKSEGQIKEALMYHRKALAVTGGSSSLWAVPALVSAGDSAFQRGENNRAIRYYQQAIELDPFNGDPYVGLSQTYQALNDNLKADEYLSKALKIEPGHSKALALKDRSL